MNDPSNKDLQSLCEKASTAREAIVKKQRQREEEKKKKRESRRELSRIAWRIMGERGIKVGPAFYGGRGDNRKLAEVLPSMSQVGFRVSLG